MDCRGRPGRTVALIDPEQRLSGARHGDVHLDHVSGERLGQVQVEPQVARTAELTKDEQPAAEHQEEDEAEQKSAPDLLAHSSPCSFSCFSCFSCSCLCLILARICG